MPLPSDALDEHAALVAHELAAPLGTAADAVRLLRGDDVTAADREVALGVLERSIEHAQQVVRRLRTLHLDDGALVVGRERTDLVALVRDTVADLARTALVGREVEVLGPASLPWVVDPVTLRLVLENLLGNAARHAPAEHPIEVTVADGGEVATVRVADHGHGVAPQDAERIFERFERGRTSGRGLGLGLYLSRRIARAHGGDLVLEPAREEGAVFVVHLPRGDA